jgi:hypothetical protein
MTVSATNAYSGPFFPNGSTTAFPFTFKAASTSEVSLLMLDSAGNSVSPGTYSVSLNVDDGGTVTFSPAPASGLTLYILSNPLFTQTAQFTNEAAYLPSVLNSLFDRAAIRDAYLLSTVSRAVLVNVGETPPTFDELGVTFKGDPGSGGNVVATRTALAAIVGNTGDAYILTEIGRFGTFRWKTANMSANITADPAQGIYVPPASDTTGASGAWVRQFNGAVNPTWFGVSTANTAAGNTTAILALNSYANFAAGAITSGTRGSVAIEFPLGVFSFNAKWQPKGWTGEISGQGMGAQSGAPCTELLFPQGDHGLQWNRADTENETTGTSLSAYGNDGMVIRDIRITGSGGSGTWHGIRARCPATYINVAVTGFPGDGLNMNGTLSASGADHGSVSGSKIYGCTFSSNGRNGVYVTGADANAIVGSGIQCIQNGGQGVLDESFLGNLWEGVQAASNVAGPYSTTGASACSIFVGCYSEGDQPPAVMAGRSMVIGGIQGAGVVGPWIQASEGRVQANKFLVSTTNSGSTVNVQVGSDVTNGVIMAVDATGYASGNVWNLRVAGLDVVAGIGYVTGDIHRVETGPGSLRLFGRGTATYGVTWLKYLALGADTTAGRRIDAQTSSISATGRANNEFIFNLGAAAVGDTGLYTVISGGLQPVGIVGMTRIAAQADSTATDVAGLKADFNAFLAKARTANILAP